MTGGSRHDDRLLHDVVQILRREIARRKGRQPVLDGGVDVSGANVAQHRGVVIAARRQGLRENFGERSPLLARGVRAEHRQGFSPRRHRSRLDEVGQVFAHHGGGDLHVRSRHARDVGGLRLGPKFRTTGGGEDETVSVAFSLFARANRRLVISDNQRSLNLKVRGRRWRRLGSVGLLRRRDHLRTRRFRRRGSAPRLVSEIIEERVVILHRRQRRGRGPACRRVL